MSEDHLGLFDTSPDRKHIRFGLAIVGLLLGAMLLVLPVRDVRWREIGAFAPTIDAVMSVGDLITATLLYAQATVFRSRALTVVATGFLFSALMLVSHALTFPGAFAAGGLLGAGVNTTAWLSIFQRAAFPIAIIFYVLLRRSESTGRPDPARPAVNIASWVVGAFAVAATFTLLTTSGHDWLPPFFVDHADLIYSYAVLYQGVILVLLLAAAAMLMRTRKSLLDIWLLVALAGWMIQSLLIMTLHARYTAGFYCLYVILLVSHLVVMIALVAESNRLYARLAISTAARSREREGRLTSMDAMVAVITHEIGQPLSAVNTNVTSGISWLDRDRQDIKRALQALHAALDAGRRAFDVIKSTRGMFDERMGDATDFSLNDLVLETVSLMERELAAAKVSLQLMLDEALPPMLGDRVQLQQVLVNLITNAIDSLQETQGRRREIAIRSALLDDRNVSLEVSDTGVGISAEKTALIFHAFFTTKASGSGLGLALCRTIVELHGGRLWVSRGDKYGATFHIELPCRSSRTLESVERYG